jgi:hypothetical protein
MDNLPCNVQLDMQSYETCPVSPRARSFVHVLPYTVTSRAKELVMARLLTILIIIGTVVQWYDHTSQAGAGVGAAGSVQDLSNLTTYP